jgi:conjugal transfer pilus assembly protein TraD
MISEAFDPYIRKPYELYIGLAWAAAAGSLLVAYLSLPDGRCVLPPCIGFGALALRSLGQGFTHLGRGNPGVLVTFMTVAKLMKRMQPERLWLGWGFDWTPTHTQRAVDTMLSGVAHVANKEDPGSPWIHGLNRGKEEDIYIPLKSLEGHTLMFGTTGSGKTRIFEILITQAIARGDTVIVIDPKGDKELRDRMETEASRAGRDDAFLFFHPAFPTTSIRLDPMRNFTRTTEIASRIASLLPSQSGGSDAFTAFAFRALNLVAQGLIETGKRPSIKNLRYFIEGGAEALLVHAIEAHADRTDPSWKQAAEPFFIKARAGKAKKMETITNPDWLAVIEWYRSKWSNGPNGSEGIDGLLSLVEHNRLHFSKMIASLLPHPRIEHADLRGARGTVVAQRNGPVRQPAHPGHLQYHPRQACVLCRPGFLVRRHRVLRHRLHPAGGFCLGCRHDLQQRPENGAVLVVCRRSRRSRQLAVHPNPQQGQGRWLPGRHGHPNPAGYRGQVGR